MIIGAEIDGSATYVCTSSSEYRDGFWAVQRVDAKRALNYTQYLHIGGPAADNMVTDYD